ncbi:MAG: hypothetical protein ABII71_06015 [Candidatus Micrarchaeota archaeon]
MIAKNKISSGTNERAATARPQAVSRGKESPLIELPQWEVCDPTGRGGRTSAMALAEAEGRIRQYAEIYGKIYINLGESDKCKLTALNNFQGRDGGGEACLAGHHQHVPAVIMAMNGEGIHMVRLVRQQQSDESRIVMASPVSRGITEKAMRKKYCELGYKIDRSKLRYTIEVENEDGSTREIEQNLQKFGNVLRHWQLTLAWHLSLTDELVVDANMPEGYVQQQLRSLEMAKIERELGDRPGCFRINDIPDGMITPFGFSDLNMGAVSISGNLFQMKIATDKPADTWALRKYLPKTRKGWAGVLTGVLGQSDGNTFMGNPANDRILRATADTFWNVGQRLGAKGQFRPVAGHTTYRTNSTGDVWDIALELKKEAMKHLPPGLRAVIGVVGVKDASIDRAKALLELQWMGAPYLDPALLPHMDRVLNIIEYLSDDAIGEIKARLKAMHAPDGSKVVDRNDLEKFNLIAQICSLRRTVRNTADFKAIIDYDREIGDVVRLSYAGRKELWTWLCTFAQRNGKRVKRALDECIEHS